MSSFNTWLATVIGKKVANGDCGQVPYSWAEYINPGIEPYGGLPSVADAKDFAGFSGPGWQWVANNHSDINQLPAQGDVLVFGATPATGYTNTFVNPYGHAGVCDSASTDGYTLVQQNAPSTGENVNVTTYPWKFRPCEGWIHPTNISPAPTPTPPPQPVQYQTITLPETTGPWHLYAPGYAGNKAHVLGLIEPEVLHEALTYPILASLGNGVYRIQSQDYGIGDLWTNGSSVEIN